MSIERLNKNSEMILDKLYSVQLYDYYDSRCYDPIRVLGFSHFNGFLIANLRSKLVFNLQNGEGHRDTSTNEDVNKILRNSRK